MRPITARKHPRHFSSITATHLDAAYRWLKKQRHHHPHNADVWDLRFHWQKERRDLLDRLAQGTYCLSPLSLYKKADGQTCATWCSRDALVLNALTQVLETLLPVHPRCEHVRGHQGGKGSALRLHHALRQQQLPFVFRTDIKGYYANIDKQRLYEQLTTRVEHPGLLLLLWQFLHYSVEDGGNFHTPSRGISRACSLSPLLAAFHLYDLDSRLASLPRLRYARYMDDFILLAPTRWALRRGIRCLKNALAEWGFTLHPDKTQLGRSESGFDWMGLWLNHQGITCIAPRARQHHRIRLGRLYEQTRHLSPEAQAWPVARYRQRWRNALLPIGGVIEDADDYALVTLTTNCNGITSWSDTKMSL